MLMPPFIVPCARSVSSAGGTMRPIDDGVMEVEAQASQGALQVAGFAVVHSVTVAYTTPKQRAEAGKAFMFPAL